MNTLNNLRVFLFTHSFRVRNSYGLDVFLLYGAVKNVPDSDRFSSIIV